MSSGERARPAAATDGAAPTERERRVPNTEDNSDKCSLHGN